MHICILYSTSFLEFIIFKILFQLFELSNMIGVVITISIIGRYDKIKQRVESTHKSSEKFKTNEKEIEWVKVIRFTSLEFRV